MCLVWNETRNRRNGGGIGRRRKRLFGVIECSDVESGVLGKKIVLVVCTIYGLVRLGITMAINAHICTATIHTEWATYLTWLYYIHTHRTMANRRHTTPVLFANHCIGWFEFANCNLPGNIFAIFIAYLTGFLYFYCCLLFALLSDCKIDRYATPARNTNAKGTNCVIVQMILSI